MSVEQLKYLMRSYLQPSVGLGRGFLQGEAPAAVAAGAGGGSSRFLGCLLGFGLGAVPDKGSRVAFVRHEQRRIQRCCQERRIERDGDEFASLVAGAFPGRAEFDMAGRSLGGDAVVRLLGAGLAGGLDVHGAEAEAQGEDVTREGVGFLVVAEVTNNHIRLL